MIQELKEMFGKLKQSEISTYCPATDDCLHDQPQARETPFRYWKRKACERLGTLKRGEKSRNIFGCFDARCRWQGKQVTLNAYILHLKRHHGQNVQANPDTQYLPRSSTVQFQ